jgi:hypothetical protein
LSTGSIQSTETEHVVGGSNSTDDALREAIDYGLLALGEIVREAIYERIEMTHHVKRGEIPEKFDTFDRALRMLVGPPVKVIERLIAKDLYGRLSLNFVEHANWTIVDHVDYVKKRMSNAVK